MNNLLYNTIIKWSESRKTHRVTNTRNGSPKALEEGEISSDDLEDEVDGFDDQLMGGEDDKRKLEKMSEREREEELFKRAERREALEARRAVKRKLKAKREKERAEKLPPSEFRKKSTYADVFGSDSDDNKSDSDGFGPRGIRDRKIAIEKRKEAYSGKFQELIEQRRQQAAKKMRLLSDVDDDQMDVSRSRKKDVGSHKTVTERVFSSDDSDISDSSPTHHPRRRGVRYSSSSSDTQRSASPSDDDARGRSRSPQEEFVSTPQQLSKIRLSRHKIEKWVHMPFFDSLVKGCFVRANIGLNQGVPFYRCAEIVDVVETPKIYDIGATRTNKGVVLRLGREQTTFRLAFVSNQDFTAAEFESWFKRIQAANMKPPTLDFVKRKEADIYQAITQPIRDERVVEQIIQSKRRFQRTPTNFAMRKADLIKQRELAESSNDTEGVKRIELELEEIEMQADRIDRRRTSGFKSMTSINQRNRMLSLQQAEEAIRKETQEAAASKEEDPFTRVHSQPIIVTKKYLESLRNKRTGKNGANVNDEDVNSTDREAANDSKTASNLNSASTFEDANRSTAHSPQNTLHAIHNFELDLDIDAQPGDRSSTSHPVVPPTDLFAASSSTVTASERSQQPTPTRRSLNLTDYKKRHGLI